jgi:hypothetical protein
MNRRLAEQIVTIVSQAAPRAHGGAIDVVVVGEPRIGALCEELAAAGAQVAICASAAEMPAFLHPVVIIDAGSAPIDIRIDNLLISLTRLAPAGIYVATAPFVAGPDGGSGHLTLFDAILAIAELLVRGTETPRGLAVLPRSDGRALELSTSPMEVRAFFEQAVAAVEERKGLVVVRRSDAVADRAEPIDASDLPAGPAFEARRLSRAIGAEGLADLALERFDRRVIAEIDILKRQLAQRDRDLAELRAAFKGLAERAAATATLETAAAAAALETAAAAAALETAAAAAALETAAAAAASRRPHGVRAWGSAASDPSSDFRDRMRRLERSIRKIWNVPLALLGKSKEKR